MSSNNYKHTRISPNTALPDFPTKSSFWQSPLWVEVLRDTKQAKDIIFIDAGILIERRQIIGKYTALYILGADGELITDDLLGYIRKKIVHTHDLFLQIESLSENAEPSTLSLKPGRAPFRRFIEPVTALIGLTDQTQELLMKGFAEKGRYNIRLAEKRGVITKWVKGYEKHTGTGKTYLEEFFSLLDETTKRDGFAHNTLNYYRYFVETLEAHNAGGLLIAEKDGIVHAAGIFAYWKGTGIYYYGASSSDSALRRDMATYLLQWEAICEARRRGCTNYDFLGISVNGKGKLAGVTEFKLRFNPEKKHWPQEQIIVLKPILLFIFRCISKARKIFK